MEGENKDKEFEELAKNASKVPALEKTVTELLGHVNTLASRAANKEEVKVVQEVPDWLKEMGRDYGDLKRQALAKKQVKIVVGGPKVYAVVTIVSLVLSMVLLFFYLYENHFSEEAYARRAYEVVIALNYCDSVAAVKYGWVRENWAEKKDVVKASVEYAEREVALYGKVRDELASLHNKEVVVSKIERSESGDDLLAFWYFVDESADYVAHFWPDGKIDVAGAKESGVTSLEEAHRFSKNKAWVTLREATETR